MNKIKDEEKNLQIRRNLKIFGWITLIQMGVGTWFWLSMPREVWKIFMGGSMFATILITIAWLGALFILHAAFTGRLSLAMILGGIQVLLMVIIRDLARMAYLDGVFHPSRLENVSEWSPLVAFLLVFIIGIVLIYYMIRLMFKSQTPQS